MKTSDRSRLVLFVCLSCVCSAASAAAAPFVSISPKSLTIRGDTQQRFTPYVILTTNKAVTWSVNGVPGGTAAIGTISVDGLYTAPSIPPGGGVTVVATSVADATVSGSAPITILNPVPSISSFSPASVAPGAFAIVVTGRGFVPTSTVVYGRTSLKTTWVSTTRLLASGTANTVLGGMMSVSVSNPDPGLAVSAIQALTVAMANPKVSDAAAGRFLEQSSWGPTPETVARVQQLGFDAYLDEQFGQPSSGYPAYSAAVMLLAPVQQRFMANALTGPDQLRQRVAFALSQIFVVSGIKEFAPAMFVPFLQLLNDHAFDSHASLLREVTLSPTMGHFLDMANNEQANTVTGMAPNENYARELLQLFTIGTDRLNSDGTPQLDGTGQRIATYDQAVIENLARALTGWTYPTKSGATPLKRNPLYFIGRMEPVAASHDPGEKVVLDGMVLRSGQGPQQDLDDVLDLLVRHQNTAPFLARRLIQQLVTGNPSPAYVGRVAAVFVSGPTGSGGNLRSVVKAILLDPEARRGDVPGASAPADGHLREPILFTLALLRTLGASVADTSRLVNVVSPAGQSLFYPLSVFNYFPLTYDLPRSGLRAPEFQIFTPSTAVYRANLAFYATSGTDSNGLTMDASAFEQFAADPHLLVEAVNRALLYGRMSPDMRQSIETAVAATTGFSPWNRAAAALFLVTSSSQYQVQQ